MDDPSLRDFSPTQERMIRISLVALSDAEYEISRFKELIWADLPAGFRAMCLEDGAAIGNEAFTSQEMLNHVLEEEYLHLVQKSVGMADEFTRGTAQDLESDVDETRKFPRPKL